MSRYLAILTMLLQHLLTLCKAPTAETFVATPSPADRRRQETSCARLRRASVSAGQAAAHLTQVRSTMRILSFPQNLGNFPNFGEIPKLWEFPQSLGNLPKFGKFPRILKIPNSDFVCFCAAVPMEHTRDTLKIIFPKRRMRFGV